MVAVGSRSRERAERFAAEHGIPAFHETYEALASDPQVDAVYVGTPHAFHEEHATLCLKHGKHVLCEKPLAINAQEAERMIRTAQVEDRTLMEAMWTRFLPSMEHLRQIIADGVIGEPRVLTADFGFRAQFDPSSRLFDPQLGGGALLDLGVYIISLAVMIFGAPVDIDGLANIGSTGVDEECSFVTRHNDGQMTLGVASLRTDTAREALIQGTRGRIRIHSPWWASAHATVETDDGGEDTLHLPFRGSGLTHEAEAFMQLAERGERDSSVMPLDESLTVMKAMDALRHQ